MTRLAVVVIVALALALTGCVGALAGGTFGGSPTGYQGWIDVTAAPHVRVLADYGVGASGTVRGVVEAVTDAQGHARLTLGWSTKHSAHDGAGAFLRVHIFLVDHAPTSVEVLVRPGYVATVTVS